jgi:hypothetical protein
VAALFPSSDAPVLLLLVARTLSSLGFSQSPCTDHATGLKKYVVRSSTAYYVLNIRKSSFLGKNHDPPLNPARLTRLLGNNAWYLLCICTPASAFRPLRLNLSLQDILRKVEKASALISNARTRKSKQ